MSKGRPDPGGSPLFSQDKQVRCCFGRADLSAVFFQKESTLGWDALAHKCSQEILCAFLPYATLHRWDRLSSMMWISAILLPKTGQWESCHSGDIYYHIASRIVFHLPNRPYVSREPLALGLKVSVARQCERCRHKPPELQTSSARKSFPPGLGAIWWIHFQPLTKTCLYFCRTLSSKGGLPTRNLS